MYKITISRSKKSFNVKHVENKVSIRSVKRQVNVVGKSKRGLPGKDGVGVPTGGNPGNVLTKTLDGTAWQAFDASDKYYEQSFSVSSIVSVLHNLNKYPAVSIQDSAGDEVEGNIEHISVNQLSVTFSAPFSGKITCN